MTATRIRNPRKKTRKFADECLVYYSRREKAWVAHSLYTDQIGIGRRVLDALVDLMRGLENLVHLAKDDKEISLWRVAPEAVRKRADRAQRMPEELYSVARKSLRGEWPKGIMFFVEPAGRRPLTVIIPEDDMGLYSSN